MTETESHDANAGADPRDHPPFGPPHGPAHKSPHGSPYGPPWAHKGWHHKRRFSSQFRGFRVAMAMLFAGGMLVFAYLLTRLFGGDTSTVLVVWLSGCGLSLLVPVVALTLGARAYHRYALPLADIMDAADAVAAGDFDVRVEERGSRDFRRLARSFNRMTTELARTDRQRRNLTADVAHELRTPLHIIQGNLEGILDNVFEPSPEHIEATLQETQTLARLVDDLSTLSLAESGELPLHREPVDVADLLADVATSFGPQAESGGVDLAVETEPREPLTVDGDPGRLDQILSNLVSNAIRHTPEGGRVTLRAGRDGDRICITVADTGDGIAAEDLPFVFDRFWRSDRARTRSGNMPSSGLGLAIASQLVQAHGGEITVASETGAGTTFTIDLPATDAPCDPSHGCTPGKIAVAFQDGSAS